METMLNTSEKELIIFDYTHFLSLLCNQKWTFIDVVKNIIPSFKLNIKTGIDSQLSLAEKLHHQALKVLSSSASDTHNIIRLLVLSRNEGIKSILLLLPFALEEEQLKKIEQKGKCKLEKENGNSERLLITLL
ncbi:hypothetical protein SKA34_14400 [Photobacterium sp. SKA34]|uniref:hypothetical protein n=1 Tax=Photobacterium sp. SKA34 TaxID=121723 RepID=UPI00006B1C98|nr:hypothetical protein [Photobacterium sp. SKA34]EAR54891.1 hypothetical protein SKA34_14400 [Photobacterium sp. SKA34]